jgi:hypothetical protein
MTFQGIFNVVLAQLWKGIFQLTGVELLEQLKDKLTAMIESYESGEQCVLAELLSGAVRASKGWSFTDCNKLVNFTDNSLRFRLMTSFSGR